MRIDDWAIKLYRNGYLLMITGVVNGNRVQIDAWNVSVSIGRKIRTRDETEYEIGFVNQEYRQWMKDNHIEYDTKNPIKIKNLLEAMPDDIS